MPRYVDTPGMLPVFARLTRSRAIASGIDGHQYDTVTGGLARLRDWPARFLATGRAHRARAEEAAADGRRRSAGQAFQHAARWCHFATVLPHPDRETAAAAAAEAEECWHAALGHLDPDAAVLVQEDPETGFRGVLRRPRPRPRPGARAGEEAGAAGVVVLVPGMDSTAVEFHTMADELLVRGVAVLAIDGPGQGRLAATTVLQPEYHRVVAGALDALKEHDGLDLERVGVLALSLGGFYGALSAARDPRIRAAVTVSGPSTLEWDALAPYVVETLVQRAGGRAAARRFARAVDVTGFAAGIDCPLRVVDGGGDVIPGVANGAPLAHLAPEGEYLLVPDGDHLVQNARWAWLPDTADWLVGRLAAV
ncbi:alpha/beta hydrolase family protein [Allostreptomyces psammosilenae]|uniref:Serine aminopeptidase S33 domain-containing protein n=1 Tax=Allostreptomyces psammosilenae TaxID=1892865 RepID=A0A852ZQX8_9ACTN|nr:alpha/beta fold hydrolase [Allostreptomyces psammosilenae]NYI04155.1 hypothetical protein [Allostreptomyces psammosilenae]